MLVLRPMFIFMHKAGSRRQRSFPCSCSNADIKESADTWRSHTSDASSWVLQLWQPLLFSNGIALKKTTDYCTEIQGQRWVLCLSIQGAVPDFFGSLHNFSLKKNIYLFSMHENICGRLYSKLFLWLKWETTPSMQRKLEWTSSRVIYM